MFIYLDHHLLLPNQSLLSSWVFAGLWTVWKNEMSLICFRKQLRLMAELEQKSQKSLGDTLFNQLKKTNYWKEFWTYKT